MTTMPNPKDDLAGVFEQLEKDHGAEWVFLLIGAIRDHRGTGPAGVRRMQIARELVDAEMQTSGDDENAAIKTVGERLGFTPFKREGGKVTNTLDNFKKLVKQTTRTGKPVDE